MCVENCEFEDFFISSNYYGGLKKLKNHLKHFFFSSEVGYLCIKLCDGLLYNIIIVKPKQI